MLATLFLDLVSLGENAFISNRIAEALGHRSVVVIGDPSVSTTLEMLWAAIFGPGFTGDGKQHGMEELLHYFLPQV